MTDRITSWPPNVEEWQTVRGYGLLLDGYTTKINQPGAVNHCWLLVHTTSGGYCFIYDDDPFDGAALEKIDGTSERDAAVTGFNRLIELGIIKRRSTVSVDSSADCDGPVGYSPTFTDNLE